jgi:hypothetical protein
MSSFPKALLLLTCWWLGTGGAVAAGLSFTPGGLDRSVVEMEITSFVETLPEQGWVDLLVEVRNRMDREAGWEFQFRSHSRSWGDGPVLVHQRRVTVGPASVRTFRFVVPLYPSMQSTYTEQPRLAVRITGPGVLPDEYHLFRRGQKFSGVVHRYVLVSAGATELSDGSDWNRSDMEKVLRDDSIPLVVQEMDLTDFPTSLRPLVGFDFMLMTTSEWARETGRTSLIREWVVQGGHLILLGPQPAAVQPLGLGSVRTIRPPQDVKAFTRIVNQLPTRSQRILEPGDFFNDDWSLRERFPDIRKPIGILMILVILVAGILGPLNLGVAFRKRKSLQVLWTTPLLSFGISVVVGLIIVLGDGLGGNGARAHWVMLFPEENLELSWQEQVSRTGVLPRSRFSLEEGWWLRPVAASRRDLNLNQTYALEPGGEYGGDWFTNRHIQAQILQRLQTSRAEVRVSWRNGVPVLLSTVETPFARVMMVDEQGNFWKGEQVMPGEDAVLSALDAPEGRAILKEVSTHKKSLVPPQDLLGQKGWFYAEGLNADRMVDTLSSIDWEDRPVWFLGPVVGGRP